MHGPDLVREVTRRRVLLALRDGGPMSRADVARRTGLARPTVSGVVAQLIRAGWVQEAGPGESSGGRRPILLHLNPAARLAVGAELSAGHVRAVLADMAGNILVRHKERIQPGHPAPAVARLLAGIRTVLDQAPPGAPVVGVGVGLTGLVDRAGGVWRHSPHFPGPEQPVAEQVQEATGFPVVVENDARCLALGEMQAALWRRAGSPASPPRSLIAVRVGVSIGAGLIVGGELYAGAHEGAGELGHVQVVEEGPRCACGRYGCLEAVAAAGAIARAAVRQIQQGRPSDIARRVGGDLDRVLATTVIEAAQGGDALAREVLAQAGRYIGVAVGNLINLFDPECVVIGGGTSRAGELLLGPMREAAQARALPVQGRHVPIRLATHGEDGVAVGAAALVTLPLLGLPDPFGVPALSRTAH
ncbi:ROK family transcriptional regulator [Caldinitratiruptor microaerophilus]|uniref:Serine/threonine protein kinase n=1 Tax=Caldinitratiruptor microaerophilus TaxID=671077 RepID=A0AA35G8K4_9FIRM|nr:ROK family transcriptional regulator [Caldinitratiruptor microaerophilus]BDG60528.1 serine/threonine protein kinase [Caldinitratiruptor microaerophilus]